MDTSEESSVSVFPREKVAEHTRENDLWVILFGKVYNVSQFMHQHPGGKQIFLKHAGQDITEAFLSRNHSRHAFDTLTNLYKGLLTEPRGKLRLFITLNESNPTDESCIWRPYNQEILDFRSSFLDQNFLSLQPEFAGLNSPQKEVFVFPFFKQIVCREIYKSFLHYMEYNKVKAANGTILENFGMLDFAKQAVQQALMPLIRAKFPQFSNVVSFDDIYAKTVYYSEAGDQDWPLHVDESLLTVNICIGDSFVGNELILLGREEDADSVEPLLYSHQVGQGIIHLGANRHSVGWLKSGIRCSLIILLNQPRVAAIE